MRSVNCLQSMVFLSGVDVHRDQGIVEQLNRSLTERLFGHLYALQMRLQDGESSLERVSRLLAVVEAMDGEVTQLTGKKPSEIIKAKKAIQKPSAPAVRPVGLKGQTLPSGVGVCYLHFPGDLDGGRRRATNPTWSLEGYRSGGTVTKPGEPVLYYLQDGSERGFVWEELLVEPPDTNYRLMGSSDIEA